MKKLLLILLLCMGMNESSPAQQFFNVRNPVHSYASVFTGVVPLHNKYYCSAVVVDSSNAFVKMGNKFLVFDSQGNKLIDSLYQLPDRNIFSWNNSLQLLPDNTLLLVAESVDTAFYYALLLRYDTLGHLLMSKEIPKPFCNEHNWFKPFDIKPAESGQYIMLSKVACKTGTNPLQTDIVLTKLDANFNVLWHKKYGLGGMDDGGYKILVESDGYLIAGGRDNDGILPKNFTFRALLFKTDTNGVLQWEWQSDPLKKTAAAKDVIRTKDGGYIYCGQGDGYEYLSANGQMGFPAFKGWVEKLDSNRNVVWSRSFGQYYYHEEFKKIIEAPDGRLYLFGDRYMVDSLGPTNWMVHIRGWFVTLSANGDSLRERIYYYVNSCDNHNMIYDAAQTNDGGFLMVGESTDRCNGFTPPSQRGWIVKVDSNGCLGPGDPQCWPTTVPDHIVTNKTLLYPNPVKDVLIVSYENNTKNAVLKITDLMGRKVLEALLEGKNGKEEMDVKSLAPGIYLYQIVEEGTATTQGKFVKQ